MSYSLGDYCQQFFRRPVGRRFPRNRTLRTGPGGGGSLGCRGWDWRRGRCGRGRGRRSGGGRGGNLCTSEYDHQRRENSEQDDGDHGRPEAPSPLNLVSRVPATAHIYVPRGQALRDTVYAPAFSYIHLLQPDLDHRPPWKLGSWCWGSAQGHEPGHRTGVRYFRNVTVLYLLG